MKKVKYILIIFLMVLTPALIYIFNNVQAKYIFRKDVEIAYTTSDYYFDATLDTTEIISFPATINVTVKNNNGTNYTTEDLTYTIGIDNPNCTVTAVGGNTRTIKGGSSKQETYAVTINRTKADDNEPINLTFTTSKPYSDNKSIRLSVFYGALVTNYDCPTKGVNWRIFHKDESGRIYLIADDYVPYDTLPTSTKGNALNNGDTNYRTYFTNIINDYTGSEWIRNNTNTNAQKWLNKYLTAYPNSTNDNMKAVAYMMDTTQWNSKFKGDKAEYVIGGPTLELFCASYKVTHPDGYLECDSVTSTGYQVRYKDGTYEMGIYALPNKNAFNKIYMNSDYSKSYGMWLASPSACYITCLKHASCDGNVNWSNYLDTLFGFRPVVCLNAGVQLISNGDGTYKIQ